jgi:hypothetical protein
MVAKNMNIKNKSMTSILKNCPVCNSKNFGAEHKSVLQHDMEFSKFVGISMGFSKWRECLDCKHFFLSTEFDKNITDNLYKTGSLYRDFSFRNGDEDKVLEDIDPTVLGRQRVHSRHFNQVKAILKITKKKLGKTPSNIVDFGAGFGAAQTAFQDHGFHYIGSEIDPWCLAKAKQLGRNVRLASDIRETFDLIYSSQVHEHIGDPYLVKSGILSLAHPGTVLYIDVPSHICSLNSITNSGINTLNWAHYHSYTPESISKLAESYGFTPFKIWVTGGDIRLLAIYKPTNEIKIEVQKTLSNTSSLVINKSLGKLVDFCFINVRRKVLRLLPERVKRSLKKWL